MDIRDGGFVEQVAVPPFALGQRPLDAKPDELRQSSFGEDLDDEESSRICRHRPRIEDAEMAKNLAIGSRQRDPQVALDRQTRLRRGGWEALGQPARMVAYLAEDNILAWAPGQVPLDVWSERVNVPVAERASTRRPRRDGDQRVTNANRLGHLPDQGREETVLRVLGFDESLECDIDIEINDRHTEHFGPRLGERHGYGTSYSLVRFGLSALPTGLRPDRRYVPAPP